MYLDHYNLHLKPFQISTDPRFLWLGEKHKEALAVLKYGILDNKGFLLLTGDVGTGKTTLLNALIDSLGDEVLVALVTDPGLAKMDFFNFVADSFEMDKHFRSKGDFLIYLKNYLLNLHQQNKQALLIIDECQHLTQKMLEEVRLLSNIEKQHTKLINIFFVGQSEFNEIILRPRNRAIRQRITINYNISALTEAETDTYIRFRLEVAGAKDKIFTSRAIKEVFKFSNGYPRLINIICDQALLTGYVKEKRKIDRKIVAECAAELKIPHGLPTKQSMATPEAADWKPAGPAGVDMPIDTALEPANRKLSRPLVAAFVVVVIIWIGLVATFFLNRQPSIIPTKRATTAVSPPRSQAVPIPAAGPLEQSNPSLAEESSAAGDGSQMPPSPQPTETLSQPDLEVPVAATPAAQSASQPTPAAVDQAGSSQLENNITLEQIQASFGVYPEIVFEFDSNALEDASYDMLAIIARYYRQHPGTTFILRGYTDASGVRTYNIKLSEFRANMVKTYLVGKGVAAQAIETRAIGPGNEGPGGTPISSQGNRRKVVIEIIPPQE